MPTIHSLSEAIAAAHPNRAFFVHMVTFPSPNKVSSFTHAPHRLQQTMLTNKVCHKLLERMRDLPAQVLEYDSSMHASASASSQGRQKRSAQQQQAHGAADNREARSASS